MRLATFASVLLLAACEGEAQREPASTEPATCPPNVSVGGPCVRASYCLAPPAFPEGVPPNEHYADCPSSLPVPPTQPSNVGEPSHLMAGRTCEERRRRGAAVCCYEYLTFCAR